MCYESKAYLQMKGIRRTLLCDMKRILLVHNYYQIPGGEDVVVANEKAMLEAHGHEVCFYSRNNLELKGMGKVCKLFLPFTTIFNLKTMYDVIKIIRKHKIDVVHVHNTLNLVSPAVYYATMTCHVPVVQTIHNFRMLCPGATFYRNEKICEDCLSRNILCAIKNKCYRGSRIQTLACVINMKIHSLTSIYKRISYICLTEFNKQKLLEHEQIIENQVYVKPNFVKSVCECHTVEERNGAFIFVGRLDKLKGIDLLLRAWKKVGENAPKLIICGTGPLEEWCKKYVYDNGLDSVELRGYVANAEAKMLIARCKALILPTQWYEGFPMSIVEAFSVGTPVVCSNLGNSGSLVEEGVTGAKFKFDSEEDMIDAIFRVTKYPRIHETTYKVYHDKYTEESNYRQLIKIYDKVTGSEEVY